MKEEKFKKVTIKTPIPTEPLERDDTLGTLYERGRPDHLLTKDEAIKQIIKWHPEKLLEDVIQYAEYDILKFSSVLYHIGMTEEEFLERFHGIPLIMAREIMDVMSEADCVTMKITLMSLAITVDAWAFLTVSEIDVRNQTIKVIEKPNYPVVLLVNNYLKADPKKPKHRWY